MTTAEMGEGVSPAIADQLKVIAFAMASGLVLMAGLVCWAHLNAAAKIPSLKEVQSTNTLTTVVMVGALGAIIASEVVWRLLLRKSSKPMSLRVQTAYIARLACRECAGLVGMTIAYISALNGVLRLYPAYWVNMAPFVLFLGFILTHWPTAERLSAEVRDLLDSGL